MSTVEAKAIRTVVLDQPVPRDAIIEGDCIARMSEMPAASLPLVFADPPFNIGYDYDEYDDRRSAVEYLDWSRLWMDAVVRVLADDGTFWLAIGDEYAAELKVLATRELGLTCRSWVVWYYTFGVHCENKFTRSHAHLFHFVKDAKRFTFNTEAIRVPSARQLVYADRRANPKGRVPDDTWIAPPAGFPRESEGRHADGSAATGGPPEPRNGSPGGAVPQPTLTHEGFVLRPQDLPGGFGTDSNMWYYPRVCGTFRERGGFHGCQMPEQILGRIIRASSNEGDCVLDPFAGSGTTLAVAKKLGRRYLGFELSKEYVRNIRDRLERIRPGDPLDGVADPMTSVANTRNGRVRPPEGQTAAPRARSPRRRSRQVAASLWEQA
jgi:site-specific DNA-methyltransferase (adenine-specific)